MLQSQGVFIRETDNIATRGWFIGMMLAIAFLLLILIIVCIVKRNRGGKYAVHEQEAAHGRTDFNEEQGFPEFAQPYVQPCTNLLFNSNLHYLIKFY